MIVFVFFNDPATTEISTLSLHDALPILHRRFGATQIIGITSLPNQGRNRRKFAQLKHEYDKRRSEEHTSELQSRQYLVCRLLLEKKTSFHYSACFITLSMISLSLLPPML